LAAVLLCSGVAALADAVPGFSEVVNPLLDHLGLPMSEQDVAERIAFRPFIPTPNYNEAGLMPAFHGDDADVPQNRGIGFEYSMAGNTYVLREWPLAGGSLNQYPALPPVASCSTGHLILGTERYPRGVAWTAGELVFALQSDVQPQEHPNGKALRAEWTRLIKRGACR
jgi:hypothetical protein